MADSRTGVYDNAPPVKKGKPGQYQADSSYPSGVPGESVPAPEGKMGNRAADKGAEPNQGIEEF